MKPLERIAIGLSLFALGTEHLVSTTPSLTLGALYAIAACVVLLHPVRR